MSGSESTSDSDSDSFDDDAIVEKKRRLFNKIKRIDKDMDDSASSLMNDKSTINRQWVYLRNALGHLLRLYRCLLQSKKVCTSHVYSIYVLIYLVSKVLVIICMYK